MTTPRFPLFVPQRVMAHGLALAAAALLAGCMAAPVPAPEPVAVVAPMPEVAPPPITGVAGLQ